MVFRKLFSSKKSATNQKPSEPQILIKVRAEQDSAKRAELINQIEDIALLETLVSDKQKELREQAQQALLSRLMPANQLPLNASSETLIRIASLTTEADIAKQAIELIDDESTRLELAKSHQVAKVRLAAAQTLHSQQAIKQLYDAAQGKDKAVYRLCKEFIAQAQQVAQDKQKLIEKVEYIHQNLEQLIKHQDSPDFVGRLQVLQQRWQEISPLDASMGDKGIPTLFSQAENLLAAQKAAVEKAKEEAKLHALQEDVFTQAQEEFKALEDYRVADLQTLIISTEQAWRVACISLKAQPQLESAYDKFMSQIKQVLSAYQYFESETEISELASQTEALSQEQKSRLKTHLAALNWPKPLAQPDWLKHLVSISEQTVKPKPSQPTTQAKPVEISPDQIQKIESLIQKMDAALEDGHASEATNLDRSLTGLLKGVKGAKAAKFASQQKSLSARLRELKDWQGFAVTPKKEALCEKMEALVNAAIQPEALADQIKQLQSEWKALGYSGNDKDLWQRFHEAAEKAYEPCKAFYDQEAAKRAELVTLREQLIDELTHYEQAMDWSNADWKVVQSILDKARETFRSYSPVDRRAHQRTQKAFQTQCDQIYGHIKAEYERNLELKKALVERAAAAVELEDIQQATADIKQIQQDWKQIGLTPRGADQKLWTELRRHADAVFGRLGEARDARKAEINQVVAEAESHLAEAQEAFKQHAAHAEASIRTADEQIKSLTLPKTAYQRIRKVMDDLLAEVAQQKHEAQQSASNKKWANLFAALAATVAQEEPDTSKLPQGIDTNWFNNQLQQNNAQQLCIEMEILADIESPAADQTARMELQVKRLAQGMGKGLTLAEERARLIKSWLESSATEAELERFVSAIKATL